MVDYAPGGAALSVKGAGTFDTVAVSGFVAHHLYVTVQDFIVMALNDRPHVFSAARALNFAAERCTISNDDYKVIMNASKSILFSKGVAWKKTSGVFDITMGAYHGAEVCELVGLFLLNEMHIKFPQLNFGIYRDDGLGEHRRLPGPDLERMKKGIIALFKSHGLRITIATNL